MLSERRLWRPFLVFSISSLYKRHWSETYFWNLIEKKNDDTYLHLLNTLNQMDRTPTEQSQRAVLKIEVYFLFFA